MDPFTFLWKALTSLISDPDHAAIVVLTVAVCVYVYVSNRGVRKSMNALADATANAPKPVEPKLIGEAVGSATRDAVAPLADSVRELVNENRDLRQQSEQRAGTLETLQKQFTELKDQAEADKKNLQTQIDAQCALIQKQNEKIEALQKSLTSKDTEINEKDKQIAELTIKVKRIDELEQRVQKLEEEVKALTVDKQELQKQLEAAQADLASERARADQLAADLQRTQAKLTVAETELNRLQELQQNSARAENPAADRAPDAPPKPAEAESTVAG